jgi:hypothetical protein
MATLKSRIDKALVVRKHVHGQFDMFPHYLWNVWVEK